MLTALLCLFASTAPLFAADSEAPTEEEEDTWNVEDAHGPTHSVDISVDEGTWMSVSVHEDTIIFDLLGDLWSLPLEGGTASRLTEGAAWDSEPRFSPDGSRIAFVSDRGGNEQIWVMNADGTEAKAFTDEDTARVTDPIWDPTEPWIIARRRTVDTRSIGVTELWQYHEDGGKGFALTSKDDHPHAGEATTDGKQIWFSSRHGRFSYDANPVGGLWRIERFDRDNGEIRGVIWGSGSAARPSVLPDGSGLVFVSRDRERTILEHFDFTTKKRRVVADWLDHDQMEGFALHGVYPAMDWTREGDLVLWAGGKLWRLSLDGTRVEIPFAVQGEWTFHDVPRWEPKRPDTVTAKVIRWPTQNHRGDVAFSAMGRLWVANRAGQVKEVSSSTGYAPRWSADGRSLIWTSWNDADHTGRLHITHGYGRGRTETLSPHGMFVNPTLGPDGRTIVTLRDPGGGNSPNLGSAPWYELMVLRKRGTSWNATVLPTTVDTGTGFRAPKLTIHDGRIWWLSRKSGKARKPSKSALVSVAIDGTDRREHVVFPGAVEADPSPDFTRIAYKLDHQAWIAALPRGGKSMDVDTLPRHQLTEVVGDWLSWSPGGQSVLWVEGNVLHEKQLDGMRIPQSEKDEDEDEDTSESKDEDVQTRTLRVELPRAQARGIVALTHATLLSMDGEPMDDATIVIDGDRIISVDKEGAVPPGARVIDCTGKTIIPGLIDVHGHMHYSSGDVLPGQPWQYLTSLDFGVTTVHDPSAATDLVFTQAERVEAGLSVGPRVYSTGYVLYGALGNTNAETPKKEAAHQHVKRLALAGAISVKVYQQSQRQQRQWYVNACNENEILCIAEGGGDLWQDLSMVADGFQAVEHSLPNAPLYADVRAFMAASQTEESPGTAYTPTLLVAYGGLSGEVFFYQNHDPHDNERLLRHWDRRSLDRITWRRPLWAHQNDWNHQQVARDAAKMFRDGVLVTLGAHGQLQGLGAHWELWALGGPGAMTPLEAIEAATMGGARYLGMESVLGSITPGKFADLIVLDNDPRDDLLHSTDIHFVMKGGEIYE